MATREDQEQLLGFLQLQLQDAQPGRGSLPPLHRPQVEREQALLEAMSLTFASRYSFSEDGDPDSQQRLQPLLTAMVQNRLLSASWLGGMTPAHQLALLQCLRLLTRDHAFRILFVDMGGAKQLVLEYHRLASIHLQVEEEPFTAECLVECCSIIKRLAGDMQHAQLLLQYGANQTLQRLLSAMHGTVLQLTLVSLGMLASTLPVEEAIGTPEVMEQLVVMVEQYDLQFQELAAHLLVQLSKKAKPCQHLLRENRFGRLLGLLQSRVSHSCLRSLLAVVHNAVLQPPAVLELCELGGVPVLLSLLQSCVCPDPPAMKPAFPSAAAAAPASQPLELPAAAGGASDDGRWMVEIQLACSALTHVCQDDDGAYLVRQSNGVHVLTSLLLQNEYGTLGLPFASVPAGPPELAEMPADAAAGGGGGGGGGGGSGRRRHRSELEAVGGTAPTVSATKAHIFRALRFVFSMDRNRGVFKRLFPPELFSAFIDVGHYQLSLQPYHGLVSLLTSLGMAERRSIRSALQDIDMTNCAAGQSTVGGYVLLEVLGKGAFGSVYKARRAHGETMVALKQIPLSAADLFGTTDAERSSGVSQMAREVEILSSLRHPNIVQYYESFAADGHLYIAMELVEGLSLLDHLLSLREKRRHMPEADIWQVLIAVLTALNYIHSEKGIVHRDLTPSNIVLGHGHGGLRSAKLTDFGLARRQSDSSYMQSTVGTLAYTCPEIIQHQRYSEKADMWSLGCVLYHMLMLRQPFDGGNPFRVASRIVEGTYDPVTSPPRAEQPYSAELTSLVPWLLTTDPERRPSIVQVTARTVPVLMKELDRAHEQEQRFARALHLEKQQRRRNLLVRTRKAAAYHRLLNMQGQAESPASPQLRGLWPGSLGSDSAPSSPVAGDDAPQLGFAPAEAAGCPQAGSPMAALSATGRAASQGLRGRTISIPQSRLRRVEDPCAKILAQLHKLMWVDQQPPFSQPQDAAKRRILDKFRRLLFGPGSTAGHVKQQLVKLTAGSQDVVDMDVASMADGLSGYLERESGRVTYEGLNRIIEHLLAAHGYHTQEASFRDHLDLLWDPDEPALE